MSSTQLSPAMRERYGLDRNPWKLRALVIVVVVLYVGGLVFFGTRLTTDPINPRLLTWTQAQPDRVDLLFEVYRPGDIALSCLLRAQDADRNDIAYVVVEIPPGESYVQEQYQLRTLGEAALVELLTCAPQGEQLRAPPPQFPPGIVPPAQPWTPPAD